MQRRLGGGGGAVKEWMARGRSLADLDPTTRLSYTLFLLFCLAGYVVMAVLAATRAGFLPGDIGAYYAGDAANDLYPKTFGELIETTHFHLFSIPLMVFVQSHLFLLAGWPRRYPGAVVLTAYLSTVLYIAAPWLITYAGVGWSPLLMIGRSLLGVHLLLFTLVPLVVLWRPRGRPLESDPETTTRISDG